MSSKELTYPVKLGVEENTALAIRNWEVRELTNRITTIIEAMGLSEKQEDAVQGLIRQAIHEAVYEPDYRIIVNDAAYAVLLKEQKGIEPEKNPGNFVKKMTRILKSEQKKKK